MESFLTTALCGFAKLAENREIQHANPTLKSWLSIPSSESLEGRPLDQVLATSSAWRMREEILPRVRARAAGPSEPIVESLILRAPSGSEIPVLASLSLIDGAESGSGAPLYQAVFIRTPHPNELLFPAPAENREVPALAEDEVKQLSQLSHELRTPLQAISLTTYVLLEGDAGPINDEQRADLERIQRSAQDVSRIVNEILSRVRVK